MFCHCTGPIACDRGKKNPLFKSFDFRRAVLRYPLHFVTPAGSDVKSTS
jgi:hypothetical protein